MKETSLTIVDSAQLSQHLSKQKTSEFQRKIKPVIQYSLNSQPKAIALAADLNKQGIQVFLVIDRTQKQITVWTQTERVKRKQKNNKKGLSLRERYNLVFSGKTLKPNQHRIIKCYNQNK